MIEILELRREIDKLKNQIKLLQRENEIDEMTGLYNQNTYEKKCKELIEKNPKAMGVFYFFDMDNLKLCNDIYGHEIGDRIIMEFSQLIGGFRDEYTVVFRIAGDEFGLFRFNFVNREEVEKFTSILENRIEGELDLKGGKKVPIKYSAGGSVFGIGEDADTYDFSELKKFADLTMYQIKKKRKNTNQNSKMNGKSGSILLFNKDLHKTYSKELVKNIIKKKQLSGAYQPIIELNTNEIYGYEGLSRPTNPNIFQISELINLIKMENKLYEIDSYIIESLDLLMMQQILKDFTKKGNLFINIEAKSVEAIDEYIEKMTQMVKKLNKSMTQIVLELSSGQEWSLKSLNRLLQYKKKYKFLLAIDGFEMGYTNNLLWVYLQVDFFKIGRSFIKSYHMEIEVASFKNFIEHLKSRGIKVICEGIETKEQLDYVKSLGSEFGQGYYLGKPE